MTDQMSPATIPAELVQMLDEDAGKAHGVDGPVLASLARILARHEQQVRERIAAELRAVIFHCPTHDAGEMPRHDPRCVACQRYAALVGVERLVRGHESWSAKALRELRQTQAESVAILDGLKDD